MSGAEKKGITHTHRLCVLYIDSRPENETILIEFSRQINVTADNLIKKLHSYLIVKKK
jgi:hypothetical protein